MELINHFFAGTVFELIESPPGKAEAVVVHDADAVLSPALKALEKSNGFANIKSDEGRMRRKDKTRKGACGCRPY